MRWLSFSCLVHPHRNMNYMQCLRSDCSDFIQENFAIQAKAYMYKDNLKLYIFKIYNLNLQLYYNLKLYIKTKYLIYYSQSLTWILFKKTLQFRLKHICMLQNFKLYIFKIYNLNLQLYYNLKLYIKTKYLIYYSQSLTWHTLPHIFLWLPFSSCRSHLISM